MSVGFSVGDLVLVGENPTYSLEGGLRFSDYGVEKLTGAVGRVISLVDREGDVIVEFAGLGRTEALRGKCLSLIGEDRAGLGGVELKELLFANSYLDLLSEKDVRRLYGLASHLVIGE